MRKSKGRMATGKASTAKPVPIFIRPNCCWMKQMMKPRVSPMSTPMSEIIMPTVQRNYLADSNSVLPLPVP